MGRHGNTFCPRRAAKNGNFCPRRATKGRGERQHPFVHEGRGGPRRTATATPFVHEGPRRAAENGNGNTFCTRRAAEGRGERQRQHLLSTKGREGPRRTATATPFVHEGPRRAAKNGNGNTLFVHEGPRRTTKNGNGNTFCPRRATRGRGELPFDPRSARGEWRGVRRERTLGPSQSGGAGTVAGALRFLVAG